MEGKKMTAYQQLFKTDLVEADSLEDFMIRYRRHDRYHSLSDSQKQAIKSTHESELKSHGITWVAGYDSNTGKLVSWMPPASNHS